MVNGLIWLKMKFAKVENSKPSDEPIAHRQQLDMNSVVPVP